MSVTGLLSGSYHDCNWFAFWDVVMSTRPYVVFYCHPTLHSTPYPTTIYRPDVNT